MMKSSKIIVISCLIYFLVGTNVHVCAQGSAATSLSVFSFINLQRDTITNAGVLDSFFAKLKLLTDGKAEVINIVHIGDSHTQADFLTGEIRKNLQKSFGNAGRGLVAPLRLAGTNEPFNYRISSASTWQKIYVKSLTRPFEPGLAGVSVRKTDTLPGKITIKTQNKDSLDYSFSKITLVCRNDSTPFEVNISDSTHNIYSLLKITSDTVYPVNLNAATNQLELEFNSRAIIDGFILRNQNPGIVYHTAGVNGAHFSDFNRSPVFFKQMSVLTPDLIIVSLGTNEGVSYRMTSQMIVNEVDKLLKSLADQGVFCPVLLVTPFDNYYRRKSFNKYLKTVNTGLIEAAKKNGLAYLDAYQITGGYGSAASWRRNGMLGRDRVHYTQAGYRLQGNILYQGLINSFNKWCGQSVSAEQ